MAGIGKYIPSMVDGLDPEERKVLHCSFKRVKEAAKFTHFYRYVIKNSAYPMIEHSAYPGTCKESIGGTLGCMVEDFYYRNNVDLLRKTGKYEYERSSRSSDRPWLMKTELSPITRFLFHKDDDNILNYLKDDAGKSIEPEWFMPVIPLILVNGCDEEQRSYIPKYNPRQIIKNVRHLLSGEIMEPVDPWYRRFKGTIQKNGTNDTYTVCGDLEEIHATKLKITELPVCKDLFGFHDILQPLKTADEEGKDPYIKKVRNYSLYGFTVDYEVTLSKENMLSKEDLLKKFKLIDTISTSNMRLLDHKGRIKKYDTPEQILVDFFRLRLDYYEKRRNYLLDSLEIEVSKLENKIRFIQEIVNGREIVVITNRRNRADLILELKQKNFTPFPKEEASGYQYLLSMADVDVKELYSKKKKLSDEVASLKKSTIIDLWNRDLDALELQLDELDEYDAMDLSHLRPDESSGSEELDKEDFDSDDMSDSVDSAVKRARRQPPTCLF